MTEQTPQQRERARVIGCLDRALHKVANAQEAAQGDIFYVRGFEHGEQSNRFICFTGATPHDRPIRPKYEVAAPTSEASIALWNCLSGAMGAIVEANIDIKMEVVHVGFRRTYIYDSETQYTVSPQKGR